MKIVDLPVSAARSLYDDAIHTYVRLVGARARAVYLVGNVTFPGLSDIDLLVVLDRPGIAPRHFFSAKQRLPRKFLQLFLHEPFMLPERSLDVLRHTTHYHPRLLRGDDVLQPYLPVDTSAERWCRMLEGYCSYRAFAMRTRETQIISGRWMIAVANAFRYLLADARHIFPGIDEEAYVARITEIRANFFSAADPRESIQQAWAAFGSAFDGFAGLLERWLDQPDSEAALNRVRALLRGEQECTAFDPETARRRASDIDRYYEELARLGLPYGGLFFAAAHPGRIRTIRQTPLARLMRGFYAVQRRLTEYGIA